MDRIIDVKYLLAFGIDLCDLIFCRHVIRHQTIVPCASLPSIPPSHSSAINGWFVNLCVWANYNLFALIKLGLGNEKLATYCFHSQLPTKIISKHSPSVAISSGRSSFVFRRFPLIFERVLHHRIIIIIDHHFPLHPNPDPFGRCYYLYCWQIDSAIPVLEISDTHYPNALALPKS